MLFLFHGNRMSITSNPSVLLSSAAVVIRRLAHQHVPMRSNAVPLVLWDGVFAAFWNGLGRCPGKVISSHLDVIVGEFTELVVIHTQKLSLLACSEVKARDVVDGVGDDERHDECPSAGGKYVCDLDIKDFPLMTDPATGDDTSVHAIEADDIGCTKEGIGEEAENTGDAVLS